MNVSTKKIGRLVHSNICKYRDFQMRYYCKKVEKSTAIPTNPLKKYYSASEQPTMGAIYDNKPFKYTCIAGKTYSWCSCGRSNQQPFCDGTHRNQSLRIKNKPIRFTVEETTDYWLCNCKQTLNRPFCDGTHLKLEIKQKRR